MQHFIALGLKEFDCLSLLIQRDVFYNYCRQGPMVVQEANHFSLIQITFYICGGLFNRIAIEASKLISLVSKVLFKWNRETA